MKTALAVLLVLGLATRAASAEDIASQTAQALIDDLTAIDDSTVGIADGGDYEGFFAGDQANGALERLRFYYPKTYAALGGKDLEKRNAFEADGKARRK